MASSDFRSALHHFPGTPGRQPGATKAGAETDLSCSAMGCVVVPLPLRRRVPGCCRSKLFAPSVAFALAVGARLPLVPAFAGLLTTRPQDSSSYGPTTCSSPKATLSWRFDARVSPPAGHQLRGCLAITPTGLSPASPPPLAGHTPRQQVHGRLRRGLPFGGDQGNPHAGRGATGEGARRAPTRRPAPRVRTRRVKDAPRRSAPRASSRCVDDLAPETETPRRPEPMMNPRRRITRKLSQIVRPVEAEASSWDPHAPC